MADNNYLMIIAVVAVVAIVAVFGMAQITGYASKTIEIHGQTVMQQGSNNLNECVLSAKQKHEFCIKIGWEGIACGDELDQDMNHCYELYGNDGTNCNTYDGTSCSQCQNNLGCCWDSGDCYKATECDAICLIDDILR